MSVARAAGRSFLFATDSWRASPDWADRLGYDRALLKQNNATSAALCAELADEFAAAGVTSAIAGIICHRESKSSKGPASVSKKLTLPLMSSRFASASMSGQCCSTSLRVSPMILLMRASASGQ